MNRYFALGCTNVGVTPTTQFLKPLLKQGLPFPKERIFTRESSWYTDDGNFWGSGLQPCYGHKSTHSQSFTK
jgi:hypothetical protein